MFTPQQIEQVSFSKQAFNGYDIQSVDAFLEPLVDDYITLYKENALLKSKMRVLVGKLAEENARVEQARQVASAHIDELQTQLQFCIEKLEDIKQGRYPTVPEIDPLPPEKTDAQDRTSAVANEISQNLANTIGSIEETEVKPQPMHPADEPTSKFTGLQFGPKYDPTR